jgi:hypothetical protein
MIADRLTDGSIICECCHQARITGPGGVCLCDSCHEPLDETRYANTHCERCDCELDEDEDFTCARCFEESPMVDGRCDPCRKMGALPFYPEFEGMVQVPEEEMPVRCNYCHRRVWSFADLQSPRIRRLFEREWGVRHR